nr:hypothetical protein [Tanacetum cinerariifolium]
MGWLWWWREGVAEKQIMMRCGRDEDGVEMVTVEMAWCGGGSCLDGRSIDGDDGGGSEMKWWRRGDGEDDDGVEMVRLWIWGGETPAAGGRKNMGGAGSWMRGG